MYDQKISERAGTGPGPAADAEQSPSTVKTGAQAATSGAKDVAGTAKQEAGHVAEQASNQMHRVAGDVRQQMRGQAQQQQSKLVEKLRQAADELRDMADGGDGSPTRSLVSTVAERTRGLAERLESRGPTDLLADVQSFARRRPGTFLLAAAAAGFLVGRVGKSVLSATGGADNRVSGSDSPPVSTSPSGMGLGAMREHAEPPAYTPAEPASSSSSTSGIPGTQTAPAAEGAWYPSTPGGPTTGSSAPGTAAAGLSPTGADGDGSDYGRQESPS